MRGIDQRWIAHLDLELRVCEGRAESDGPAALPLAHNIDAAATLPTAEDSMDH
jgi:hypothetical protein